MDWWTAVYGVTQSRTRLKRLSSSSSRLLCPPLSPGACLGLPRWLNVKEPACQCRRSALTHLSTDAAVTISSHIPLHIRTHVLTCSAVCLHQAPLSMGFSRQEYWGGLPFPPPGDLPNPGIQAVSLMSPALAGRF